MDLKVTKKNVYSSNATERALGMARSVYEIGLGLFFQVVLDSFFCFTFRRIDKMECCSKTKISHSLLLRLNIYSSWIDL